MSRAGSYKTSQCVVFFPRCLSKNKDISSVSTTASENQTQAEIQGQGNVLKLGLVISFMFSHGSTK